MAEAMEQIARHNQSALMILALECVVEIISHLVVETTSHLAQVTCVTAIFSRATVMEISELAAKEQRLARI
jgi:hypothetical protein